MMPNLNGLEAIRDIKRIKKIPVVILSALDHNENIKDSQGNSLSWTHADLFLQKPLNFNDLKNILKTIEEIKNG